MVFSTSGTDRSSNSMYFFQRQLVFAVLGVFVKGATRWLNIGIQFQVAEGLIGFRKKYRSADLFLLDGIHLIEDNQIAIL